MLEAIATRTLGIILPVDLKAKAEIECSGRSFVVSRGSYHIYYISCARKGEQGGIEEKIMLW